MQRGVQVHELIRGLNASTVRIEVRLVYLVELTNVLSVDRILLSLPYCGVRRVDYSLFIFKINISYLFTAFN
nr:MAG TPA: hypothetical protein [Caudoviricetes sp.]